jgi:hypothetical protein
VVIAFIGAGAFLAVAAGFLAGDISISFGNLLGRQPARAATIRAPAPICHFHNSVSLYFLTVCHPIS